MIPGRDRTYGNGGSTSKTLNKCELNEWILAQMRGKCSCVKGNSKPRFKQFHTLRKDIA